MATEESRRAGCTDYSRLASVDTSLKEDNGLSSHQLGYRDGMRRELMEEVEIDGTNEATMGVLGFSLRSGQAVLVHA